jgi:hypothetical protein
MKAGAFPRPISSGSSADPNLEQDVFGVELFQKRDVIIESLLRPVIVRGEPINVSEVVVLHVFVEENPISIHQRYARRLKGMPLYHPLHVLRDIGLEARMDDVAVIPSQRISRRNQLLGSVCRLCVASQAGRDPPS